MTLSKKNRLLIKKVIRLGSKEAAVWRKYFKILFFFDMIVVGAQRSENIMIGFNYIAFLVEVIRTKNVNKAHNA